MSKITKRFLFRKTNPAYHDSFSGDPVDQTWPLLGYPGFTCKRWDVQGLAASDWDNLKPSITEYLSRQKPYLHEAFEAAQKKNYTGPPVPPHLLQCFMVGYDETHARPFVVVICALAWFTIALKHLIKESGLLIGDWRCTGMNAEVEQPALRMDDVIPEFEIKTSEKHRNVGGQWIQVKSIDGHWTACATVGGFIRRGAKMFGLTVGHVFHRPTGSVQDTLGWSNVNEDQLDWFEDDEISVIQSSESVTTSEDDVPLDMNNNTSDVDFVHFEKSNFRLHHISGVLSRQEKNNYLELDWAAVVDEEYEPKKTDDHMAHIESNQKLYLLSDHSWTAGIPILLQTRQGHFATAKGPTMLLGIPWSKAIQQEVWVIQLHSSHRIERGDCGAWARDFRTGEMVGMLIATCPELEEAYLLPASRILQNAEMELNPEPGEPVFFESPWKWSPILTATETTRWFGYDSKAFRTLLVNKGYSPSEESEEALSLLLSDEVDFSIEIQQAKKSPILWAAKLKQKPVVELLFDSGKFNYERLDNNFRNLLSYASELGWADIVEKILDKGRTNPDTKSHIRRTPLSYAAFAANEEIVRMLLAKVDPDAKDRKRRSPLSYAASAANEKIVQMLLATGWVDPDTKDRKRRSPLSYAAAAPVLQGGQNGIIKLLLATGKVDPDSKDRKLRTPLSYASQHLGFVGSEICIQLLLETGKTDPDAKDQLLRTPLSYVSENAGKHGSGKAVELLLATDKVDPDFMDRNRRTPLSYASERANWSGSKSLIRLLLATGQVNPDAADLTSQTPIDYASKISDKTTEVEEIVQLLLQERKRLQQLRNFYRSRREGRN